MNGGKLITVLRPKFRGGQNPPVSANLILNLDAQREVGYSDGLDVTTPVDHSGGSAGFTMATAANKPHWRSAANGINSHPAFEFDSSVAEMYWQAANSLSGSAADYTFYAVLKRDAVDEQTVFDSQTGRLLVGLRTAKWTYYDSSFKYGDAASTSAVIVSWVLNSTGTAGVIYANGVGCTPVAYAQRALGGITRIGESSDGASGPYDGLLGQILIYTGAHSATDRGATESFLSSRWGVALA